MRVTSLSIRDIPRWRQRPRRAGAAGPGCRSSGEPGAPRASAARSPRREGMPRPSRAGGARRPRRRGPRGQGVGRRQVLDDRRRDEDIELSPDEILHDRLLFGWHLSLVT